MSNQFAFADHLAKAKHELTKLRNEYITNDKADILFLVDTSSSLSPDNFIREKQFVTEFLGKIRVSMEATRVEVIPFGNVASIFIDYVSVPALQKTKCAFNEKLNTLPQRINGWMRNVKAALQLAYDVCVGKYSGQKRGPLSKVKTTVILLTNGMWNYPGNDPSPVSIAQQLHAAGVEVYAIGVGPTIDFASFGRVTRDPSTQAFHLASFNRLIEFSLYLREGKWYKVNPNVISLHDFAVNAYRNKTISSRLSEGSL